MTDLPPYDRVCAALAEHPGAWTDGALRAVFLDARGAVVLTVDIEEGTGHVDELFLRHLVTVVSDLAVAAVVFASLRASGRPSRVDKLLWRELSARIHDRTTLLDLLVVGDGRLWSLAQGAALTSHTARWPERTPTSI
jgi:DNA repair protein RadC